MKRAMVAVASIFWTWLWLLPIAGFHHMWRCGLLGWAILDGEDGPIEVRWSGWTLLMSVAVWLLGLAPILVMRLGARREVSTK